MEKLLQLEKQFQADMIKLSKEIDLLAQQVEKWTSRFDQWHDSRTVIFYGLPGEQTETSEELVNKVISKLNMKLFADDAFKLSSHDVDKCYRMRSRNTSCNSRPIPTKVVLTSCLIRNKLLVNRKKLKGDRLSLNEYLPPHKYALFSKTKSVCKEAWVFRGNIYCQVNNVKTKIINEEALNTYFPESLNESFASSNSTDGIRF